VFVSLLYWSAKKCDWLSLAGPAPFPFPIFLFPAKHQVNYQKQKHFKNKIDATLHSLFIFKGIGEG